MIHPLLEELMKKVVFLTVLLALLIFPLAAADQNGKDFGVGLYLGQPLGITVKYDLSNELSVAGGLGFTAAHHVFAGVQYKFVDFSIEKLEFHAYAGGNVYFGFGNDFTFGIDLPVGVSYYLDDPTLEFFLEIGPTLKFAPEVKASVVAGLGARYELDF